MNLTKKSTIIILAIITILFLILFYFLGGSFFKEGYNNYRPSSGYTTDEANDFNINTGVHTNTDYDNYNHYNKSSFPTIFYGPNGATAKLILVHGEQYVSVVDGTGNSIKYNIDKIIKECQSLKRAVCNSNRAKAVAETINKILIETLIQVSINTPRIEINTIIKNVPKSVLIFFKTNEFNLFNGRVKNKSIDQINIKNRPETKEYQLDSNKNQPKCRQVTKSNPKENQVIIVICCCDFIERLG